MVLRRSSRWVSRGAPLVGAGRGDTRSLPFEPALGSGVGRLTTPGCGLLGAGRYRDVGAGTESPRVEVRGVGSVPGVGRTTGPPLGLGRATGVGVGWERLLRGALGVGDGWP